MIVEKTYLPLLQELKELAASLPNSRTFALAKVAALIRMNMCWEAYQLDKNLNQHPFEITHKLVAQAIKDLESWEKISFCDGNLPIDETKGDMEAEHHDLFQSLWTKFDAQQYIERIELFNFRLSANGLDQGFFKGKRVIDMGCGHGNFAHAMLNAGAAFVLGVDYGEQSIAYAKAARDRLGVSTEKLVFEVSSVYAVAKDDECFDIAVQNGVFHHLEDEDRAYNEMYRVLKPGGSAWIYTEGEGSIARDLFHISVQILSEVPSALVLEHLLHLGFSINKRYHLGDGLKAVYRASSLENLIARLDKIGFGNYRRLKGGVETDLDISSDDPWSKEKFGEGDIRIVIEKPLN